LTHHISAIDAGFIQPSNQSINQSIDRSVDESLISVIRGDTLAADERASRHSV